MNENNHGYFDFSQWYPNNEQSSVYGNDWSASDTNGLAHYQDYSGAHNTYHYPNEPDEHSPYEQIPYGDGVGFLSDTFAAWNGLRADIDNPFTEEMYAEQVKSRRAPYLDETYADESKNEDKIEVVKHVPKSRPETTKIVAQRKGKKIFTQPKKASKADSTNEIGREICEGVHSKEMPFKHEAKSIGGYGWPDPDWWLHSRDERDDFDKAFGVYDRNTKTYKDSHIAFVCTCNAKVAKDLVSKDPSRVERAIQWIDQGVPLSEKSSFLLKTVGVEMGWRVYRSLAERLNCSVDQVIGFIGPIIDDNMAKALASGDSGQFEAELNKIKRQIRISSARPSASPKTE